MICHSKLLHISQSNFSFFALAHAPWALCTCSSKFHCELAAVEFLAHRSAGRFPGPHIMPYCDQALPSHFLTERCVTMQGTMQRWAAPSPSHTQPPSRWHPADMLPLLTHGIAVCLKDGYRHRVWLAMATTGCGSKSYEAHLAHHIAACAAETSHNYMGSTHTYAGSAQIQLRAARPTYEGKKLQDEPRR